MFCLTGDLHHSSLRTGNQRHCDITEIEVARRYLQLLEEARVKVTFFVSGRSFTEEGPSLRPIVESELVELGGHNFTCFTPAIWHRVCKKLLGSYPGPRWYELQDVRKTIAAIERGSGRRIRSWRNHMYMRGPHTDSVLAQCGIEICSDGVRAASHGLQPGACGVAHLPINVLPDHEHLYHAERTPEWVDWWVRRYRWKDDFGSQSYLIEEWTDIVLAQLEQRRQQGGVACLIIHPITMYLCDRFRSFLKILDFLSRQTTLHVSELGA